MIATMGYVLCILRSSDPPSNACVHPRSQLQSILTRGECDLDWRTHLYLVAPILIVREKEMYSWESKGGRLRPLFAQTMYPGKYFK